MYDIDSLDSRTWTEDSLGTFSGGTVGGDVQASESLGRQFARKIDGLDEYVVIDFTAYIAIDDINGDANDLDQPHGITVMVTYAHCTDPNEVGDTESNTDMRYWDHQERDTDDTVEAVIARINDEDRAEAVNQMGV